VPFPPGFHCLEALEIIFNIVIQSRRFLGRLDLDLGAEPWPPAFWHRFLTWFSMWSGYMGGVSIYCRRVSEITEIVRGAAEVFEPAMVELIIK